MSLMLRISPKQPVMEPSVFQGVHHARVMEPTKNKRFHHARVMEPSENQGVHHARVMEPSENRGFHHTAFVTHISRTAVNVLANVFQSLHSCVVVIKHMHTNGRLALTEVLRMVVLFF